MASDLSIEVVYVTPDRVFHKNLTMPVGSCVQEAIECSDLYAEFPETLDSSQVGIYGKVVPLSQQLREGDRVEVYRDLIFDPKEARRMRAKKKTK